MSSMLITDECSNIRGNRPLFCLFKEEDFFSELELFILRIIYCWYITFIVELSFGRNLKGICDAPRDNICLR